MSDEDNWLFRGVCRVHAFKVISNFEMPFYPTPPLKSIGTGFFVERVNPSDGKKDVVVLTCSHVVENTHEDGVRIVLPVIGDGEIKARILSICPEFDIAALGFEMTDELRAEIRPLDIAASADSLALGDKLTACGYPLGQSGLKRTDGVFSGWEGDQLQHSVPISQGNSGGPLLRGRRVVGINSSGIMEGSNIGYAIPIDRWNLIRGNVDGGEKVIRRPLLGFCYQRTDHSSESEGVYIYFILDNSPMRKAGLRVGDILTDIGWVQSASGTVAWYEVNQRGEVKMAHSVQRVGLDDLITRIPFSNPVQIKFRRGGKEKITRQVVRDPKCLSGGLLQAHHPLDGDLEYISFFGMCIMQHRDNHRAMPSLALECEKLTRGQRQRDRLIVTFVFPGFASYVQQTVFPGSFVVKVNGRRATTLEEFRKAVEEGGDGKKHEIQFKGGKVFSVDIAIARQDEKKALEQSTYQPDAQLLAALEVAK